MTTKIPFNEWVERRFPCLVDKTCYATGTPTQSMFSAIDLAETALKKAYVLSYESPDPSTKLGAVIYNHVTYNQVAYNQFDIIGAGVNAFPYGIDITDARIKKPTKYQYMEHAERNAIYSVARNDRVTTQGAIMYVPWFSCINCARAIINSGIKHVIGHYNFFEMSYNSGHDKWFDEIKIALKMFKEANVECALCIKELGVIGRVNGETFQT